MWVAVLGYGVGLMEIGLSGIRLFGPVLGGRLGFLFWLIGLRTGVGSNWANLDLDLLDQKNDSSNTTK